MIEFADLIKVKKIISHANCPDGTVSAMICKKAYGDCGVKPEIEFVTYKTEEHLNMAAEPGMMFVDFSPPEKRWREFKEVGTIVLDHHATAAEYIKGDKVIFVSDKEGSGASLCLEHVLKPLISHGICKTIPQEEQAKWDDLAKYAQMRDTWDKENPEWEKACDLAHGIMFCSVGWCLDMVDTGLDMNLIETIGRRCRKKILQKSEKIGDGAIYRQHGLVKVAYYNNTEHLASDIGEYLGDKADFSVSYSFFVQDGSNKCLLSFRSRNGYDVRNIAKKLNGGGHPGAAGAMVDLGQSMPDLLHIMNLISLYIPNPDS